MQNVVSYFIERKAKDDESNNDYKNPRVQREPDRNGHELEKVKFDIFILLTLVPHKKPKETETMEQLKYAGCDRRGPVLAKYLIFASNQGYGKSKEIILFMATSIAKKRNKTIQGNCLSEKWWRGFLNRHPELSMRASQNFGLVRTLITRPLIEAFYKRLLDTMTQNQYGGNLTDKPHLIFNCDESGFEFDAINKIVAAARGAKHVPRISKGQHETITVMACSSAAGNSLPPMFIYKSLSGRVPNGVKEGWCTSPCHTSHCNNTRRRHPSNASSHLQSPCRSYHTAHCHHFTSSSHLPYTIASQSPYHAIHTVQCHRFTSSSHLPYTIASQSPYHAIHTVQCHRFTSSSHLPYTIASHSYRVPATSSATFHTPSPHRVSSHLPYTIASQSPYRAIHTVQCHRFTSSSHLSYTIASQSPYHAIHTLQCNSFASSSRLPYTIASQSPYHAIHTCISHFYSTSPTIPVLASAITRTL
ncbi:hypothetical protein QZH41_006992 [Actinostola sp. cb2023]|nr:hypothetical protein QZH41_006992 [Actinostola sp. cb2023]